MLIPLEGLTREEIRGLDLFEQGQHLSDVLHASADLGRELISATTTLAALRAQYATDKSDTTKASMLIAAGNLDALKIRARTLREMKSILQTLLRSASTTGV